MEEVYRREEKIEYKRKNTTNDDIIKAIIFAKKQLEVYNKNFEYAEGDLIDYYTYQIKALTSKINYLIKKAKNNKISNGVRDYKKRVS